MRGARRLACAVWEIACCTVGMLKGPHELFSGVGLACCCSWSPAVSGLPGLVRSSSHGWCCDQGLLCGALQVVVQKLSETEATKGAVMQLADQCIQMLQAVFQANSGTVHEEAMLAVGALTYACGASFSKYLNALFPIIERGLQNTAVRCSPLLAFRTSLPSGPILDVLASSCIMPPVSVPRLAVTRQSGLMSLRMPWMTSVQLLLPHHLWRRQPWQCFLLSPGCINAVKRAMQLVLDCCKSLRPRPVWVHSISAVAPLCMQEGQVCSVTVGVLGDICRAVEHQIASHTDSIMNILLTNLQSATVSRDLKPQILSAFGDIALALGDGFEKYLSHVLQVPPAQYTVLGSLPVHSL